MEGEWPLVGRASELERLTGLVGTGAGGVVLAGPAGVGKTRLAGECLALAAARGFAPVRVAATAAVATLPFGAYAALLPDPAPGADRTELLRQLSQAITGRGEGRPVALMVDDAHLLDEGSAALTHQLAASKDAFVCATVRSGEPVSEAVVALWKDGLAQRLELAPFSLADVEEFLVAVLGGAIDGATVRVFFERTQGNLLFLKELVLGAVEAGALRDDGGLWRLHGRLPASARLVELFEARLADLAAEDRGILEVVALGEPLGVDLLVDGKVRLGVLEDRGLARVEKDGRRLQARLAHPLYGDVLRSRLSPLRSRVVSRALAEATTQAGARRRDDVLRVATWELHAGGAVDPDLMLAGARQAHSRNDLDLAERLARAAREAGGGFEAGLLVGAVMSQTGRLKEADAHLGALTPEAADDQQKVTLALTRIAYLIQTGLDEAIRVADEAEAAIADPAARAEVAAWRTLLLSMGGQVADARQLAESVLPLATGRGLIMASQVACRTLGAAGRLTEALAANARGVATQRVLEGPPYWFPLQIHLFIRAEPLVVAGRSPEVEADALEEYAKAVADGSVDGQMFSAWTLTLALLAQGRVESAAYWGRLSTGLARQLGRPGVVAGVLLPVAMTHAHTGHGDKAAEVMEERAGLYAGYEAYQVQSLVTRAWVAVSGGDRSAATELLWEAAMTARSEGSFAHESAALHDLARLGHASEVVTRLAELAETIEGPLAAARLAHAAAVVSRDPAGLGVASVAFEEMKAMLLAAEAAADAAVSWRKAGDPHKAAAAERRAHSLAARCEGACTPALTA